MPIIGKAQRGDIAMPHLPSTSRWNTYVCKMTHTTFMSSGTPVNFMTEIIWSVKKGITMTDKFFRRASA